MIKPRMNIFERIKVRKRIKLQVEGSIYISDFCKKNMCYIEKYTSMNAPHDIRILFENHNTCDGYTHIYVLNSKYDIMKIALAYNNGYSKLFIFDNRINNYLLDIAIAMVESKIGIKRLINDDYLK